jgi:dephospho-CoA kinase
MLKIGLTGGIGSGKTRVANMLAEQGASVIDTDVVAHQLTAPNGLAMPAIVDKFGPHMVAANGSLNRALMRQHVFADPAHRHLLESILHPMITQEVIKKAEQAQGAYIVLVVPLLVETRRWLDQVDRICVVDCDTATQIERVKFRSGLTQLEIESILLAQASREARLAVADDVIHNTSQIDFNALTKQVLELHRQWCNLVGYDSNK